MAKPWYRAYVGAVSDPKFGEVAMMAETSRAVAFTVFAALLESASEVEDRGRTDMTPRRCAALLNEHLKIVQQVFDAMEEIGLITKDDGVYLVVAWERRQRVSDSSAERVARWRDKQRSAPRNEDVTLPKRDVAGPESETDTDTDPLTTFEDSSTPAPPPVDPPDERPERVKREVDGPEAIRAALQVYNIAAAKVGWPQVSDRVPLSDRRRKSLAARLRDVGGIEGWREAIDRASRAPWLTGRRMDGGTPFFADLDFLIRLEKFTKLIEGGYDARIPVPGPDRPAAGRNSAAARELAARDLGAATVDPEDPWHLAGPAGR